jgi:hypothetical protein
MTKDTLLTEIGDLTVEGTEFTLERLDGEPLIKFFKEHGSHFDLCRKSRKEVRKAERHKQLSIGGKAFRTARKVQTYIKSI